MPKVDGRKNNEPVEKLGKRIVHIRLTAGQASAEMGMDVGTLNKRLRALGIEPGDDNRYSIAQACAAKYGSKELEQSRNIREQADGRAMENEQLRKNLMPTKLFFNYLKTAGVSIKQVILSSNMEQEDQDALSKEIAELFLDEEKISREIFGT